MDTLTRWGKQAGRLLGIISLWMDGSLFFRAVTGLLDWVKRVCASSFFLKLFTADYDESRLEQSRFVQLADALLNRFPKKLKPPDFFPETFKNLLSGSFFTHSILEGLNTAPPSAALVKKGFMHGLLAVLQWAAASFPVWGILLTVAAAPFLPTMMLAGLLVLVMAVTLFRYRFVIDLTAVPLLLFIVVTVFAGLTSFDPRTSLPIAFLTSVLMFSYMLVLACCRERKQIDFFFFAFTAAAVLVGLVGFYQFITKQVDTTWVDIELFGDIPFRAYSTFGNPNVYGAYLLLAIPLSAALFLYAKKPFWKFLAALATSVLLVNLLLSYSRGCYLALALSVGVFILLIEKRLVVFLSAGLLAAPFVLPSSVINRVLSITNLTDSSTSYRLSIWQGTLRVIKAFWLSGVGQGNDAFNVVYPFFALSTIAAPHSHNLYFQIFVETGIVGIVVFIAILACFFRTQASFMRHTTQKRSKIMSAAITAAVVGFLFQGLFDHVFYNYRVMLIFFLFLGMGGAFVRIASKAEAEEKAYD